MRKAREAPILIGICGGSGSGKTVISNELASALGEEADCMSLDSYYRPREEIADHLVGNYDHPEALDIGLLKEHLEALRRGEPIEIPNYEFATRSRRVPGTIYCAGPITILEGLLLFACEDIWRMLDYSVFIDVPADIRLARRLIPTHRMIW